MIFKKRTYFECIIPEENRRAFYEITIGQDLFGYIIIRHWGRIGTKGQPKKQQRFVEEDEMLIEFERLYNERVKHQYVPRLRKKRK
ncbi:WGR domain-containing protein [Desulfopila aestuarii]|uniref:WGR domain-containing protein, predicted DNA-binding domain in MolR n=1 Tax=Desulfopila aestuarii DSM 18488 TaxID=1121416 RepID=A0A1M7YHB7_9BACT|nr:WGR domain-containing protein [Desulfopila aestuarii]SHO52027.1 WGR domain-containing protein, predicted DNA-binding domain in MolR [Desulfopila aestuarii DSM 18488]